MVRFCVERSGTGRAFTGGCSDDGGEAIGRGAHRSELRRRRILFAAATLATMAAAMLAMARVLGADGLREATSSFSAASPPCCRGTIGFWNALVGFVLLCGNRDPVARVLPALRSPAIGPITERVRRDAGPQRGSGAGHSPSNGDGRKPRRNRRRRRVRDIPAQRHAGRRHRGRRGRRLHALAEANPAARAAALPAASGQSRPQDGQSLEFLDRHGPRFDHMLVLDADSVMSGRAIVRLVR